jgi:hypothetical protein
MPNQSNGVSSGSHRVEQSADETVVSASRPVDADRDVANANIAKNHSDLVAKIGIAVALATILDKIVDLVVQVATLLH